MTVSRKPYQTPDITPHFLLRTPSNPGPNGGPGQIRAFTLVELLVVIGIIAVLIGILLPALNRARAQGVKVRCQANMRTVGQQMLVYANSNRGWLFPPRSGANVPLHERWMVSVFKFDKLPDPPTNNLADYTPKVLLCPADATDVVLDASGQPFFTPGQTNTHTYVLSLIPDDEKLTYSKKELAGLTPDQLAIMGEKISNSPAYYMGTRPDDPSYYPSVVNFNRHGQAGSNYLFMDLHVSTQQEKSTLRSIDPWTFKKTE